jgi:hypothetical protein
MRSFILVILKNMRENTFVRKIICITVFSISMAFVESAVVVYLRSLYYPKGFSFPLKLITDTLIGVEVLREVATIFMLLSVSALTGRKFWERFAYFIFCFGMWDIFYYVWLKVLLDWPVSIFDWDILFLIPIPWIGPVIAPVTISVLMIIIGIFIIRLFHEGYDFKPPTNSRIFFLIGTGTILYSFMKDTGATLHQQQPLPYLYELLIIGELLYIIAFAISYKRGVNTA